ncbi:MAG: putative zinc-binding protein [Candidatus Promineifilaceae bacterium]
MPELPQKKVGIVACSGEEIAEGTITRLAALKVLEELRPQDTVTICLPLFLAGGEGERAFARFYPTIAIDGCDQRCAARATEAYSGEPAASILVTDIIAEEGFDPPQGLRRLNEAGQQAVQETAVRTAALVDELLDKKWSRRNGSFRDGGFVKEAPQTQTATCACGSGIPVQTVDIAGHEATLIALPAIFEQFRGAGKLPSAETTAALLEEVKIYNSLNTEDEKAYRDMLDREYSTFWGAEEQVV